MTTHDRWEPKLRVAASNLGGSGYRIPTRIGEDGKPLLVPGVTTVLGVLEKPGVLQWSIDNTSAYAIANVDALLNRTEEQGFGFLRFWHRRMKEADFDNPEVDIYNYSNGVLNDLAELGTKTHDWVADYANDYFTDDELPRREHEEMVIEFLEWWNAHDIQVVETEVTVVMTTPSGETAAGTLDHIWIIDGVPTLVDVKTSRKTRDEHFAQLAALGAATSIMREVTADTPGAVEYETKKWGKTYWIEEPLPAFSDYRILHLRPSDVDNKGYRMKPFCELKKVKPGKIEAGWKLFSAALDARLAQREMKLLDREEKNDMA